MLARLGVGEAVFSMPVDVSDAPRGQGVYQGFVLIAAGTSAAGDVRVAWMDNRTGIVDFLSKVSCIHFFFTFPSLLLPLSPSSPSPPLSARSLEYVLQNECGWRGNVVHTLSPYLLD